MRLFEFILAVVVIVLTYSAFMSIFKGRQKKPDPGEAEMEADRIAERERIENLEERVRVLEKIVTDRKASLHRQFSDLE